MNKYLNFSVVLLFSTHKAKSFFALQSSVSKIYLYVKIQDNDIFYYISYSVLQSIFTYQVLSWR